MFNGDDIEKGERLVNAKCFSYLTNITLSPSSSMNLPHSPWRKVSTNNLELYQLDEKIPLSQYPRIIHMYIHSVK